VKTHKTYTFQEALKALENYCSYQERTHREVETKLYKMGMITEAAEKIIISLLENSFLNEERYAKSFARGKFRINKWGRIKITQHLVQKGISEPNIKIGLLEIDEEDYILTMLELAKKKSKLLKEDTVYKNNQKLLQYLYQKGFETALVYEFVIK